ncbi:MAG: transaldolase family protein [Propioniciclava sp.]
MPIHYYIDSAVQPVVEELLATGLFSGVTTNPAILDKAGLTSADIPDLIRWTTSAGAQRVFVQVWGESAAEMVALGHRFREMSPQVVIKVPYSPAAIEVARELTRDGEVLVTAVHDSPQVLPVVLADATFLAPFIGRMDQAGRNGVESALSIQSALVGLGADTQVLAGSLRTPEQVLRLAQAGVRHFTMGPAVWQAFFEDEVTETAVISFQELASQPSVS